MENQLAVTVTARRADLLNQGVQNGLVAAMPTYEENVVTEEEVQRLHRALQRAPKEQKLGKWYAYRSYAALYRAQNAGYHWGYTNYGYGFGPGSSQECTCGIRVDFEEGEQADTYDTIGISLSPIQRMRGHRTLPLQEEESVALIVKLDYKLDGSPTLAHAYCQVCSEFVTELLLPAAHEFVERHNKSCKS